MEKIANRFVISGWTLELRRVSKNLRKRADDFFAASRRFSSKSRNAKNGNAPSPPQKIQKSDGIAEEAEYSPFLQAPIRPKSIKARKCFMAHPRIYRFAIPAGTTSYPRQHKKPNKQTKAGETVVR